MVIARVNGIEMNYRVNGEGPTLVMAHGLMGSIATMAMLGDVSDLLWDSFRIVNYDARGHGESGYTTNPADYTWTALASDMYRLMQYLGIERAHVGGGSMGAGTGILFALEHPEVVEKLVLIMPPPMLPESFSTAKPVFLGLAALIERDGLESAVKVAVSLPPNGCSDGFFRRTPTPWSRPSAALSTARPCPTSASLRSLRPRWLLVTKATRSIPSRRRSWRARRSAGRAW
jgi:pimeloyl-ACP methyl ester carboxylesterase